MVQIYAKRNQFKGANIFKLKRGIIMYKCKNIEVCKGAHLQKQQCNERIQHKYRKVYGVKSTRVDMVKRCKSTQIERNVRVQMYKNREGVKEKI